jgi:DNA-binding NarL/FixJ family response regulator
VGAPSGFWDIGAAIMVVRMNNFDSPDDRAKELSPRLQETLQCLLDGNSEKSIATRLRLSPHTVHGYVKLIYRHFQVKSRAQLLSQWVRALKLMTLAWALATSFEPIG